MTFIEKRHETPNHYITFGRTETRGDWVYIVRVYPIINDVVCSAIKERTYMLDERKNALSAFNRYKRKYI